jgi:D-sedoheptulose 7-phosphate isomerase
MLEISNAHSYFASLSQTVRKLPFETIDRVCDVLLDAYENGRMIYLFGNGGSAALASHFACDLGKGTIDGSKKRFRVLALTDNVPLMTAWANDSRYEDIFAEQLANFVRKDDVAFAISGSGNSQNVLNALELARESEATTIGLVGYSGGRMKELCDVCMIVPSDNMQIIEDLHLCVAHALFSGVRRRLSAKDLSKFASQGM